MRDAHHLFSLSFDGILVKPERNVLQTELHLGCVSLSPKCFRENGVKCSTQSGATENCQLKKKLLIVATKPVIPYHHVTTITSFPSLCCHCHIHPPYLLPPEPSSQTPSAHSPIPSFLASAITSDFILWSLGSLLTPLDFLRSHHCFISASAAVMAYRLLWFSIGSNIEVCNQCYKIIFRFCIK